MQTGGSAGGGGSCFHHGANHANHTYLSREDVQSAARLDGASEKGENEIGFCGKPDECMSREVADIAPEGRARAVRIDGAEAGVTPTEVIASEPLLQRRHTLSGHRTGRGNALDEDEAKRLIWCAKIDQEQIRHDTWIRLKTDEGELDSIIVSKALAGLSDDEDDRFAEEARSKLLHGRFEEKRTRAKRKVAGCAIGKVNQRAGIGFGLLPQEGSAGA